MYQIRYTCGYDLVVIGKGENGLSRIDDANGNEVFSGGYRDAVEWLKSRSCVEAKMQNRSHPTGNIAH